MGGGRWVKSLNIPYDGDPADKAAHLRAQIREAIPQGRIVPRHNEKGHFYEVNENTFSATYPSVSAKLQVLKDESLINFKMKQALAYVFRNWKNFTEQNIMEHIANAERQSVDVFEDAGDIGRRIHDYRHKYFTAWIQAGIRPPNILLFLPEEEKDVRAVSALKALEKFVIENDYWPVISEQMVYDRGMKLAGTLDDIGIMRSDFEPQSHQMRQSLRYCKHDWQYSAHRGRSVAHCAKCGNAMKKMLVLMDIKTSNQFKDHYFYQVALYWRMFFNLVGIAPERCFILKLSKTDQTYHIEDLKRHGEIARYALALLKANEGIEYIKTIRAANQKAVGEELQI